MSPASSTTQTNTAHPSMAAAAFSPLHGTTARNSALELEREDDRFALRLRPRERPGLDEPRDAGRQVRVLELVADDLDLRGLAAGEDRPLHDELARGARLLLALLRDAALNRRDVAL